MLVLVGFKAFYFTVFFLCAGNVVHYSHRDWVAVDHTPINDLLKIAGVELVNFERDTRVLTL